MDIEENEQADSLAKEGVEKHGVKLIQDSRKVGKQSQKRDREEEEQVEVKKGRNPARR